MLDNKRYNSEKGSTLLELLVVMSLLVVIMVALVSLIVLSLSTIQKSKLRARATEIAQSGMERVREEKNKERTCIAGGYNCEWDDFVTDCTNNISTWVSADPDYTVDATCSEAAATGVVTVNIAIEWSFGGKDYDVNLKTEFFPPEEKPIYR